MHARNLRRDAAEWAATRPAWLGIPSLKLAGCAAQPQQNAMLLRPLRLRGEEGIVEQPFETCRRCERAARKPFEEKPAV